MGYIGVAKLNIEKTAFLSRGGGESSKGEQKNCPPLAKLLYMCLFFFIFDLFRKFVLVRDSAFVVQTV